MDGTYDDGCRIVDCAWTRGEGTGRPTGAVCNEKTDKKDTVCVREEENERLDVLCRLVPL